MQLLPLLALLSTSLATALPQVPKGSPTELPEGYKWDVTNWTAGCARGGCTYDFNVTGAFANLYPGFKAYCSGKDTGYYQDCKILEDLTTSGVPFVAASLRPNVQNGIATMSVSLKFTDAGTLITRNITGWHDTRYTAFSAPAQNFVVTPSEVVSVL